MASAGQLSDNPGKWKPDKVFEPLGANCTILTVRHSFESQRDKTAIEGKQLMEWCQDTVEYTFAYQNQSTAYSESPLLSRRNDRKYKLFSPMADVCHGAAGYRDPVCGHLCSVGQEVPGGIFRHIFGDNRATMVLTNQNRFDRTGRLELKP